jgi:hypothetical protein
MLNGWYDHQNPSGLSPMFPLSLHLLFDYMEKMSPSLEAVYCTVIKKIYQHLWNQKFHCRVHKCPPQIPLLSQINPLHIIPFYLPKFQYNIIFPHTSWSSSWSLSFWLSYLYPIWILTLLDSIILIVFGEEYKLWTWTKFRIKLTTVVSHNNYRSQFYHPSSEIVKS